MKKTKMVAVFAALVLGLVITSCGNLSSGGGSTPENPMYPIEGQGVVSKTGLTLSGTELSKQKRL